MHLSDQVVSSNKQLTFGQKILTILCILLIGSVTLWYVHQVAQKEVLEQQMRTLKVGLIQLEEQERQLLAEIAEATIPQHVLYQTDLQRLNVEKIDLSSPLFMTQKERL